MDSEKSAIEWVLNESKGTENQAIIEDKRSLSKPVAMKNALMYLTDPIQHEPILSFNHKAEIANSFGYLLDDSEKYKSLSARIKIIKEKLLDAIGKDKGEKLHFFYLPNIRPLWDKSSMPIEINTIYYGPPGTGKTYLTKGAAEVSILYHKGDIEEQLRQVQFHPGFGYEDFIDGLKPELINGNVALTLKNGEFKEFCIKAAEVLRAHRIENGINKDILPPNYYFIVDEINRADLSAVFGEVLSCLEEDKRLDFDGNGNYAKGLLIKTQNSHLITKKEDAVYKAKNGEYKFGIPSNIVFIGTMNDIDRSVDTFDFALRRRFTWVRKGFDEDVLANCDAFKELDLEDIQKYIDSSKELNCFITDDLALGGSYEIGHAYFMNIAVRNRGISKSAKKELFDRHFAPLLQEYLRSAYSPREVEGKLKEAQKLFINDK